MERDGTAFCICHANAPRLPGAEIFILLSRSDKSRLLWCSQEVEESNENGIGLSEAEGMCKVGGEHWNHNAFYLLG